MADSDFHSPTATSSNEEASAEASAALRTVIQLTLRTDLRRIVGGCPIDQCGLRENMRPIVAHARRHGMRAESLLALIKDVSATLKESQEIRAMPNGADTLANVITVAVEEYYRRPPLST